MPANIYGGNMICEKCGQEFSDKVCFIHIQKCDKINIDENIIDVPLSEEKQKRVYRKTK